MTDGRTESLRPLLWLAGAVGLAAFLRLHALGSIPGFGYDEGTIAQLGREILGGRQFAVGIKPYFGPLLIYLLALSYKLLGVSILSTRLPIAILSTLMPIAAYMLTRELCGKWKAGVAAAYLVAASPWHVFFGRFAWDGNISPLFLTLYYYLLIASVRKAGIALAGAAFLCLGLTLNGHPYLALPALGPALIAACAARGGRLLRFSLAFLLTLVPLLPPVFYQLTTGFRIIDRFFGGYGHHFALAAPAADLGAIVDRYRAYCWTLGASLNGTLLYPDLYRAGESTGLILPPLLFLLGLAYLTWRSNKTAAHRMVSSATWLGLIGVPILVKTVQLDAVGHTATFTHYLDAIYPLPYVLIAALLYSDEVARVLRGLSAEVAPALTVGILALSLLTLKTGYFDYFKESWGKGHFVAGIDRVIDRVDSLSLSSVPVQAMTRFTVGSSFYPQFASLTAWRLEPVDETLFEPHPVVAEGRLIRTPTLFVSRTREALLQPALTPNETIASPDGSQRWRIYLYLSPVIYVQGKGEESELSLFAFIDDHGLADGVGFLRTKDEIVRLDPAGIVPGGGPRGAKSVRVTGKAGRIEEFTMTLTRRGSERAVRLRIAGQDVVAGFQGTVCIF
ncbi:MAG: glycosyltransferase family 39 protein [Acidobacteriota bacterium]